MRPTSFYRVLQLVRDSGHTSITIDDVAVDYGLREVFGVGLNDPIWIATKDDPEVKTHGAGD